MLLGDRESGSTGVGKQLIQIDTGYARCADRPLDGGGAMGTGAGVEKDQNRTARIVAIRGRDLIPTLEDVLDQARRGELEAVALAGVGQVKGEPVIFQAWAGDQGHTILLYGAVNVMRDEFFHNRIEHTSGADLGPIR